MATDWQAEATLYLQLPTRGGPTVTRAIHAGPLHWIVGLAMGGRYGPLSVLLIEAEDGLEIESEKIEEFARELAVSRANNPGTTDFSGAEEKAQK